MRWWITCLLIFLMAVGVSAQSEVIVTTLDNVALRAGPGTDWPRLAVLPYSNTYRAVGRSIDATWIQVVYDGPLEEGAPTQYTGNGITNGWVYAAYLMWAGDIFTLPVDGVGSIDLARQAAPTIVIDAGTEVFTTLLDRSTRVPSPAVSPVRVETTGRLGSPANGAVWLQFKMNGEYYWIWTVNIPDNFNQIPDASYLYPYTQTLNQLGENRAQLGGVLSEIGARWNALATGQPTTCNNIPADLNLDNLPEWSLQSVPIFRPASQALTQAQTDVNAALALFRTVCANSAQPVDGAVITQAMTHIENANRFYGLLATLSGPYARHDPLLGYNPGS